MYHSDKQQKGEPRGYAGGDGGVCLDLVPAVPFSGPAHRANSLFPRRSAFGPDGVLPLPQSSEASACLWPPPVLLAVWTLP